jgi:multidrug efflux pump subunit AcrB
MKLFASWLARKKASLCILTGICAVSLCVILFAGGRIRGNGGGSYMVTIRHYGIDAKEMERSVTMPLEDAFSAISGLRTLQSSSENSLSRVFLSFSRNSRRNDRGQYEAVREAAQRVYETLPSSVQRPEIQSSDNSRIPVWSAAVTDKRNPAGTDAGSGTALLLERIVKPRLESLEGAGEALISGAGIQEIIVALDQEKTSGLALNPSIVAAALGMNDAMFPGGFIEHQGRKIIVTVDGRYNPPADQDGLNNRITWGEVLIPLENNRTVTLGEIASVYEQERAPDILSRLNGKKTAVISLMGSSGADLRKLSRDIKKELPNLPPDLEFTVLSDLGAEESAALQGAFMVGLIGFLLHRNKTRAFRFGMNPGGLFCALAVPVICLVSAALLAITGFPPDRSVLAGLAAGAGAAVDPVILCSEKLRGSKNYDDARSALARLRGPLAAGAATTAAALLPLEGMNIEVSIIARAISAVTLTAPVLSLVFLPPLLLWNLESPGEGGKSPPDCFVLSPRLRSFFKRIFRRFLRQLCRILAGNTVFCVRYPLRIMLAVILVSAAGAGALFFRGVDSRSYGSENSLYAQVEFEGGLLAEETDRLLSGYGEALAEKEGIIHVQTGARTGAGNLLISFDPKRISSDRVRALARSIPISGGFVFFSETSANERYWEIKIFGDEDQKCRELAEQLAGFAAGLPLVKERALNFKEGGKKITLLPDRERLSESGIGFSQAADAARRGIHGPVAYKKADIRGEIDVRVRTGRRTPSREEALGILVLQKNSAPRLDSLMETKESIEPASIRREDRRRTASITLTAKALDPRRVRKALTPLFEKLELPPGYSIEFDPEAIRQAEALSETCLSLFLALVFCYMIIASVNESFFMPLAVLSAVPPSLAVPALCLVLSGSPFNLAAACAFVAVSGMTVNAAVLCAGGMEKVLRAREKAPALYRILRQKMPALLATAGTTIAGALPFLLLRERANELVRTLSLVTAFGVAVSCICSISAVPALSLILERSLTHVLPVNDSA